MSVALLPLSKELPFLFLTLPSAPSPLAEGPSPSEVSLVVWRVLAAPSRQGSPPAAAAGKPLVCSLRACGGQAVPLLH